MDGLLAVLGSERFQVLIVGILAELAITFIPQLEPLREGFTEIIALGVGLLIAAYTVRRPGQGSGIVVSED